MNQEEKIKYFLYTRKSSEAEDRQVASIDSQIDELTKIAQRDNLEVINTLSESQSAKAPGRPLFNDMIDKIQKAKAQGIICWKLDRLARNPVDGGQINWMLQQGIIKHIQTFERSYYPTDNVLMMSVEFGMANQFIRDLSQNTKRGLRAKAERGWYPTFATLGYMHNPQKRKGEKEIIKDPERFDLVKKMFSLMLTGNYFPPKILEIATNEWGLRNRFGRNVARSTIYRMLRDPFYYGTFEYPKGSANWHQGKHEPMITQDEYDRIQTLLGGNDKIHPREHTFPFRGLIRCGECGCMVTAEEKWKRQKNGNVHHYVYYHCTKRVHNCTQGSIEQNKLEEQILEVVNSIEIPPEFHDWALDELKLETINESGDRNKILGNQQKAYNDCLAEIDGVISMRARKELDVENYQRKIAFLTKEKARLKELLDDTDDRVNKQIAKLERGFALARDAKKEFETGIPEKQKQVLANLGSNLLLKDKILTISIENPLIQIKGMVPEVRAIHNKVRTSKNGKNERNLRLLYAQSPTLLRLQDSNPSRSKLFYLLQ